MTTAILLAILAMSSFTAQESRRVSTADLDLTTADGVRTLDRRITAVAGRLCADRRATPHHRYTAAACRQRAIRDARLQRAAAIAAAAHIATSVTD